MLRLADHPGDGNLLQRTLAEFIEGTHPIKNDQTPDVDRLATGVTCIRACALGPRRYLVAGNEDGSIRVWNDSYVCQCCG